MTTNELVNYYVRAKAIDGREYSANRTDPILPFLIADICYQTYCKVRKQIPLVHEMKRLDTLWLKTYARFNKPFFATFPTELHDEVVDLMDSLTDALANDLVILRSRIMLVIDNMEFEKRENITSLLMCYILAQFAQVAWGNTYKVSHVSRLGDRHEPHINLELEHIKNTSFKMAWRYFSPIANGNIRLSEVKAEGIFQQMANHIYKWIENEEDGNHTD